MWNPNRCFRVCQHFCVGVGQKLWFAILVLVGPGRFLVHNLNRWSVAFVSWGLVWLCSIYFEVCVKSNYLGNFGFVRISNEFSRVMTFVGIHGGFPMTFKSIFIPWTRGIHISSWSVNPTSADEPELTKSRKNLSFKLPCMSRSH